MKKGFSLLELIFAIVVIGVIASFAVPKFLDTRDSAVISTLKRDISTIISSVQAYHLSEGDIANIKDAVTLNSENWTIDSENTKKIIDSNECLTFEVKTNTSNEKVLALTINQDASAEICSKLKDNGIETQEYQLM